MFLISVIYFYLDLDILAVQIWISHSNLHGDYNHKRNRPRWLGWFIACDVETHFTPLHFNSLACCQFDNKYIQDITRVTVKRLIKITVFHVLNLFYVLTFILFIYEWQYWIFLCVKNLCILCIIKENWTFLTKSNNVKFLKSYWELLKPRLFKQ